MDVESFECKLMPSLEQWLLDYGTPKPTLKEVVGAVLIRLANFSLQEVFAKNIWYFPILEKYAAGEEITEKEVKELKGEKQEKKEEEKEEEEEEEEEFEEEEEVVSNNQRRRKSFLYFFFMTPRHGSL
jgi:CRISPR/Cas system CSM-associated protein Csm4 (group 5 of RAMP superfamily)